MFTLDDRTLQKLGCFHILRLKERHQTITIHSKNSRVRIDSDFGPRGPDLFLGQFDSESVSMSPGIRVKSPAFNKISGHNDTDSGSNRPRYGFGHLGPKFESILTREFLECKGC